MDNVLARFEGMYKNLRVVTLGYLIDRDNGNVLIAMKKRGFGVGRWNGVGGKLKEGESVRDAMIRETEEEIGVTPTVFEERGVIRFYFDGGHEDWNQEVHVFVVTSWDGTPKESEEMKPKWFAKNALPMDEMWADDRYWLRDLLDGKRINAAFLFGEGDKVLESRVEKS